MRTGGCVIMADYSEDSFTKEQLRNQAASTGPHLHVEQKDMVNHPDHYGGGDNPYEVIKVIRAWDLGFDLGNAVKYIARAGKKNPDKHIEDLEKAVFYLQDEIDHLKAQEERLPF